MFLYTIKKGNKIALIKTFFVLISAIVFSAYKIIRWKAESDITNDAIVTIQNETKITTIEDIKFLESVLKLTINKKGIISSDELCIPMENSDLVLPCGSYTRWEKE